jgi:hypothetical protein
MLSASKSPVALKTLALSSWPAMTGPATTMPERLALTGVRSTARARLVLAVLPAGSLTVAVRV